MDASEQLARGRRFEDGFENGDNDVVLVQPPHSLTDVRATPFHSICPDLVLVDAAIGLALTICASPGAGVSFECVCTGKELNRVGLAYNSDYISLPLPHTLRARTRAYTTV